jgi:2-hydroxy-3-keto-5-methylthiopentenyl-1-phosphate phosphatase
MIRAHCVHRICAKGKLEFSNNNLRLAHDFPQLRRVLREYLEAKLQPFDRIVYIGDGSGDICPCLNPAVGLVFAKERLALSKEPKLEGKLVAWADAKDLQSKFREHGLFD